MFSHQREGLMDQSSPQLFEVLDQLSSLQEILYEYDEKNKDDLQVHEVHKERYEGEMNMDLYLKFSNMLELQLLSPTPTEEAESTCKYL